MDLDGALAQLGERLLCKQEVAGSIPAGSIAPMLRKLALLALPALALVGCTSTEIDSGKSESFLRENIDGARTVKCPGGVEAKKGDTFECDVEYSDGRRAKATVHIDTDEGRVSIGPGDIKPAP